MITKFMGLATVATLSMTSMVFAAEKQFVSIGTGGVTGVYYPTGGAICRLVNKGRKDHGIRCSAESTGGSVYNINTLRVGELEFGVAQSDWQAHAYNGTSKFEEAGKFEELRSVFSVHTEPFTLVVRADANINSFKDLMGKRVNIGNAGSGQRATTEVVMEAYGMTKADFSLASELKGSEMAAALCDNKIDAMIYTIGHPAASIKEATTACNAKVISVTGPEIEKLVAENSYYSITTIPGGMYRGTDGDVATFGVGATFVTSSKVSDEVVYTVAKATLSNLDTFRKLHPAFRTLDAKKMIKDGLTAPLHDGAVKAYKELGLM
ncbi:MAG: TAXI family TRAP transporter solute-binding subunit [Rhizobiales bacterium]|nr:TAXI family TRAP transporter solute-binding subunit [Hyphomicrobiales bacterium]